jgi:Xaa-Pro aminopeptidase
MVLSNEPGFYKKNKFGIRIENLIYVKKIKENNYFDNLTMAPIDKELVDLKILNKREKDWLNNYHKKVFDSLKKFMNKKELLELSKSCSAI